MHPVDDRGGRRQEVEIELAGQPLLNDLEMQETEKPAAEAKAERVTSASSTRSMLGSGIGQDRGTAS